MARKTSIVVDPVTAVLPAEVTKTIRHINNNRERDNFIEINRTCTSKNYNEGFGLIQGDLC